MPASVLDRRLHFVIGKGGVGKTTVAAAMAMLLARHGRRTLAVEMDGAGRLCRLLGSPEANPVPAQVLPNLRVQALDGRAALEEYLGLVIPVKRLLSTVFSSRLYQYFVAVAPGLKELMTVGKIWYEATREEGGRPLWDAIVVDAPATGHGLQHFRMPEAARETFGTGLVQREATKIVELLRDARTTAVHLVTLAEEMPITETLETERELTGPLAMSLGYVVANRLHARRFAPAVTAALAAAAQQTVGANAALLEAVAARAVEENGWTAINAHNLDRLREVLPAVPVVELPYLFALEFGRDELETLSRRLEQSMAPPARAAAKAK
jgi:anion-transporting  ArsA/GET3 family ATPase